LDLTQQINTLVECQSNYESNARKYLPTETIYIIFISIKLVQIIHIGYCYIAVVARALV